MRRRRSRSRSAAALLAALAALAAPAIARAQACCAGGTALTPGRLNLHESELVGLAVRVTGITGSFDPGGNFLRAAKGSQEVDIEEDAIATLRVLGDGQISVMAPLVQTYRKVPGISELGGGFGDLQISARWDATHTGVSVWIPGVAVLAGLALPTGVPPEAATKPLSTDATGAGTVRGTLGFQVEQVFGNVLVSLTGSATLASSRVVSGIHTQIGPSFSGFGAVGYVFDAGPVAAITASYTGELGTRNDGKVVTDSGRGGLRLGISGGYAWSDWWRMQAAVFADPPAAHLGKNQPAGAGMQLTLLRSW